MITTDHQTYRIEEFVQGGPLLWSDLEHPHVYKNAAQIIAKFNYNSELKKMFAAPKQQMIDSMKMIEYIKNEQEGWYWKALNEVYPII